MRRGIVEGEGVGGEERGSRGLLGEGGRGGVVVVGGGGGKGAPNRNLNWCLAHI